MLRFHLGFRIRVDFRWLILVPQGGALGSEGSLHNVLRLGLNFICCGLIWDSGAFQVANFWCLRPSPRIRGLIAYDV